MTIATVNDKVQLQKVETWFDPLEMFRQMVRGGGVVTKEPITVPADVGGMEQTEATHETNTNEISTMSLDESKSSPKDETGNRGADQVAENSIEEEKISHAATTGDSLPSTSQPEENTDPATTLRSGATSDPSQPSSDPYQLLSDPSQP